MAGSPARLAGTVITSAAYAAAGVSAAAPLRTGAVVGAAGAGFGTAAGKISSKGSHQ